MRDHEFESAFLQQAVCLSGEPRGRRRKAPHFGGGLRVAGDVATARKVCGCRQIALVCGIVRLRNDARKLACVQRQTMSRGAFLCDRAFSLG
jgi:hypothetical protein